MCQISLKLEKEDKSVDVSLLFAVVWRLGWTSVSIQEQTWPDSRNSVICLQMVLRFTANPNRNLISFILPDNKGRMQSE